MNTDLPYWIAFSRIPGIGRARYVLMEGGFRSLADAWRASAAELRACGMDERSVEAIVAVRPGISPDAEMERLARSDVKALTWHDAAYPARLKEIYDPPPVLYVRGELTSADEWAISVVGTRRATAYGREVAERLAGDLARNGITVVSGLARGIDHVAHRAALEAGGRTIAVQACGLDMVYPAEHLGLAQQIAGQGALISDYPLGTRPRPEFFPRRNRIMSGVSLGVLVVEAPEGSGALITTSLAMEQNREVFAVPGSVLTPSSKGPHRLIQDGAKLVTSVEDILEELNLQASTRPVQMEMRELLPANDDEAELLRILGAGPAHIDDIVRQARRPTASVSSVLAMMEIKGLVKQLGGMNYVRAREARAEYNVSGR
ncbi:MAG: DNA-processing protein DprA [Dehalococcoidia bacterium]|nr:DNA-processing protein DprA [Dehalococcoidia bacterium]